MLFFIIEPAPSMISTFPLAAFLPIFSLSILGFPPATRLLVAPRAPVSRRRDAVDDGPYCSPEEPMLRRGTHLLTRARERIRAAREHDPHAWPHPWSHQIGRAHV